MITKDVRLISASYVQKGEESVIELFGKTRDKESITILVRGFYPYFFIVDPNAEIESLLGKDKEVLSLEHDKLLYHSQYHNVLKVTIKSAWKLTEYRNKIKRGFHILAGDIPLHHRYMYDVDMGSCIRVNGNVSNEQYFTDIVIDLDSFENIDSFDPGLRILSFDIENSIEHEYLYTICSVVNEGDTFRNCEPIYGAEKDIITRFGELIRKEDPDVITGYNIDNYDIRKIQERAKYNKMSDALPWGRDGSQPKLVSDRFWRVKGRLICDAW